MYWFSEKGKGGEVRLKAGVWSGLFCCLWNGTWVLDAAERGSKIDLSGSFSIFMREDSWAGREREPCQRSARHGCTGV
jgi:hypothetical protein